MCNFGICSRFWDVLYGVRPPNGSPDLLEKFMGRISIDVLFVVLVFNFPPTAKVIWRRGHGLVSSDRLEKPRIEPATPGLQGKWLIHYTTAAPI